MIVGYVGNPGSGKTYEAVKRILENLMKGKVIYTNIEGMDNPKQRECIRFQCGISDYALERQLKFLNDEQVIEFWRHVEPKALIILDELQNYFSSRDFKDQKNKDFAKWASIHRHHGYDLIAITQNPERIDAAVRAIFEWTYYHKKVNFFGSLVKQSYLQYLYFGSDVDRKPLGNPKRHTYNPVVFSCYKSYAADDIEEIGFQQNFNVLKHPIFYSIPVVLALTIYFGTKSTIFSDDPLGAKQVSRSMDKQPVIEKSVPALVEAYTKSIHVTKGDTGVKKYSNR